MIPTVDVSRCPVRGYALRGSPPRRKSFDSKGLRLFLKSFKIFEIVTRCVTPMDDNTYMNIKRVMNMIVYGRLVRPANVSRGRWSAMVKIARRELNG